MRYSEFGITLTSACTADARCSGVNCQLIPRGFGKRRFGTAPIAGGGTRKKSFMSSTPTRLIQSTMKRFRSIDAGSFASSRWMELKCR